MTNAQYSKTEHYKSKDWVKTYKKADNLTKISMLVSQTGIPYGTLMDYKKNNSVKFWQIESGVLEKMEGKKLVTRG